MLRKFTYIVLILLKVSIMYAGTDEFFDTDIFVDNPREAAKNRKQNLDKWYANQVKAEYDSKEGKLQQKDYYQQRIDAIQNRGRKNRINNYLNSKQNTKWTPIFLSIAGFSIPNSTYYRNIYGFRFGLPYAEIADTVCGIDLSLFKTEANQMSGVQVSILKNHISDGLGLQLSAYNKVENDFDGFQIGLYNSAKKVNGFQIGLYNDSQEGGIQLGLINRIRRGWLPFSILINFNF